MVTVCFAAQRETHVPNRKLLAGQVCCTRLHRLLRCAPPASDGAFQVRARRGGEHDVSMVPGRVGTREKLPGAGRSAVCFMV